LTTVALDLLGGDGAPDAVVDAIASLVLSGDFVDGSLALVAVGPVDQTESLLRERGLVGRVRTVQAGAAVPMEGDPLEHLRAHADATVSVGVDLVASGAADAFVSMGHSGATVAAAALGLGRIPGVVRPALAVVIPALAGPVVLLDAGATTDASSDALLQHALAGWAYACALGWPAPSVGLLTIGSEAGKGDQLRRDAQALLADQLPLAGIAYAGPVEGHDVALGHGARVIVTDGFTGNVLLKGLEGAVRWCALQMGAAYPDPVPAREVARATATSDFAGGLVLGVNGVVVAGHGAGSPEEVAACVRLAARAARGGVVDGTRAVLDGLAQVRL
jgi:glycerol-3-phosphate acyltransferase PlsX